MTIQFNIPSSIIVGRGASSKVGSVANRFGVKKVLLVTDSYMKNSGLASLVADAMKSCGINVEIFSGVQPDPTDMNVFEGLRKLKKNNCGMVVGLGGGSPMDCAKAISMMSGNEPPISQ